MEARNYIGIYLSHDSATVVSLGVEGPDYKVLNCFSVSVDKTDEQELGSEKRLAGLISTKLAEINPTYKDCEIRVALDCSMFMQHNVHSSFNDVKQITQTIKFDTEEAIAADVSDLAISFEIVSSGDEGSELNVFTCKQKILSDIILSLQSYGIDPVTIEPDVFCLSRFIRTNMPIVDFQQGSVLFTFLSDKNGYFAVLGPGRENLALRTFLIGLKRDRNKLLLREIPITIASAKTTEPVNLVKILDSTDTINYQQLGAALGPETGEIDLLTSLTAMEPQTFEDCGNKVSLAISCGAASAGLEKTRSVNFRNDFMPYLGKQMRMQKTLKVMGISVIILMIAVGSYFQLELLRQNKYRSQLREKFAQDYSVVMSGKKLPGKTREATNRLSRELRRIKDVKSGQLSITGKESVAAKLTLLLEAFNKCAAKTDLAVDSVSITTRSIVIAGETSGRRNTLILFDAIREMKLDILQQSLDSKSGRDNFRITVEPKK